MTTVLPFSRPPKPPSPSEHPEASPVMVGVDAHADTFTTVAMQDGRVLWEQTLSTRPEDFERCLARTLLYGVENVKAHALSLVLFLLDHGQVVYDLPPAGVAQLRGRGGGGKTDAKDARHVAQLLAATVAQRTPVTLPAETMRLQTLERARATLVSERVAMDARHAALLANPHAAPAALRAYRQLIAVLRDELKGLEREIAGAVKVYPQVLEIVGVASVMASVLVGEVLSMTRFPREAQFASYCGIAPRDHSSGRSQWVKVNPGGNRRLNAAMETITRVRLTHDPPTRAYYDKKRAQGMASRTAFRATKRQVCKLVYRTLCIALT